MKKKFKKAKNGVVMECYDANKIQGSVIELKPHALFRNASGYWSFSFDLIARFQLSDGRQVKADRRLHVGNLPQIGRKPRS